MKYKSRRNRTLEWCTVKDAANYSRWMQAREQRIRALAALVESYRQPQRRKQAA